VDQKPPVSQRQYCKKCGGHLMTSHPSLDLVGVNWSVCLPPCCLRWNSTQLSTSTMPRQ
jgi:hypothetical protein